MRDAARILMATAAALVALLALVPTLSQLAKGWYWGWALYAVSLLIPFALLVPAVIWPRSLVAAVVSALPVFFLVMWGVGATPMDWPRVLIHLAAILCLAALTIRMIRGIRSRRYRVLWILPSLLLGVPIGYLAAALLGLHIVSQFCDFPLIGPGVSGYLCSG